MYYRKTRGLQEVYSALSIPGTRCRQFQREPDVGSFGDYILTDCVAFKCRIQYYARRVHVELNTYHQMPLEWKRHRVRLYLWEKFEQTSNMGCILCFSS